MEMKLMKLQICLLVPLLALAGQTATAEALIAPSFPDSSPWVQVLSVPITAADNASKAEVKTFYLASEDKANPKNLVSITSAGGMGANVGAVEYLTSLAQGLQQNCEGMRATRPTLLLENRTPVSYARLYCSKIKGADYGVIQTIKVLQGKSNLFAAIREWHVLPFDFQVGPSATEQFAAKLFTSPDAAAAWVQQMASANSHLTNKVVLCAEKQGEFGEACSSNSTSGIAADSSPSESLAVASRDMNLGCTNNRRMPVSLIRMQNGDVLVRLYFSGKWLQLKKARSDENASAIYENLDSGYRWTMTNYEGLLEKIDSSGTAVDSSPLAQCKSVLPLLLPL